MAFELKADESVGKGIKRMTRKEIDKACDSLTTVNEGEREEPVHDARKRFKKIRAVLRLVRGEIGSRVYRKENSCFRDAARPLCEVRDAKILVEALDKLISHFAHHLDPRMFKEVREALLAHQQSIRQQVLEEEVPGKAADSVRQARKRVRDWSIDRRGWSALADGLKRVYKGGCQAFSRAVDSPTVENLHEWRKQAKYLYHQLRVLRPIWSGVMEELGNQTHQLSDYLGEDHDLAVLRQLLVEQPEKFGDATARATLLVLINSRRAQLQQQAFALGERVYGDKPREFIARLRTYWKAWRAETARSHSEAG
jgi:CHAD domain-containing protein